jgi:DNA-binding transcriptional MocR family regulator
LRELQLAEHNPPHKDFSVSIGVGSQDLIAKAFEMVIEPGCNIMLENPSYTGIVSFLHTQPCNLVSVSTDTEGIMPESLESILKNWEDVATRPKVLYTIPTGSNPTGVTVSLERKKAIYKICQEYDILIMEDDPYYFLQVRVSTNSVHNVPRQRNAICSFKFMTNLLRLYSSVTHAYHHSCLWM